jgi:hypothetical protein
MGGSSIAAVHRRIASAKGALQRHDTLASPIE